MQAEQILEQKKMDDNFVKAYRQAKEILNDEESRLKTYSYNRYKLGKKEDRTELQYEIIQKLKNKGKTLEEIADLLDIPMSELIALKKTNSL